MRRVTTIRLLLLGVLLLFGCRPIDPASGCRNMSFDCDCERGGASSGDNRGTAVPETPAEWRCAVEANVKTTGGEAVLRLETADRTAERLRLRMAGGGQIRLLAVTVCYGSTHEQTVELARHNVLMSPNNVSSEIKLDRGPGHPSITHVRIRYEPLNDDASVLIRTDLDLELSP